LQGPSGYVRSGVLGIALGVSLYCKQQAGLLSLGCASLLVNRLLAQGDKRHRIGPILLVPIFASAAFLVGILSEGKGLLPVHVGLTQVTSYQVHSSLIGNLYSLMRNDESAALIAAVAGVAWVALLASRSARKWIGEPWLELVGFLLLSALATMIQYRWRSYYHYALLAIPGVVIASTVLAMRLIAGLPATWRRNELFQILLLGIAAFPLAYTGGSTTTLRVWRLTLDEDFAPGTIWRNQPGVRSDLQQIAGWVQPGTELVVLPMRRNCIHFLLGSRVVHYPLGYNWDAQPQLLGETLASGKVSWVLVLTAGLSRDDDEERWGVFRPNRAADELSRLGFHPVRQLRTITLWRLEPP
jgi:hypothetical protein